MCHNVFISRKAFGDEQDGDAFTLPWLGIISELRYVVHALFIMDLNVCTIKKLNRSDKSEDRCNSLANRI